MPMRTIQRSISRQRARIAPLLDVLAHLDVLGLPVVGLHRAVELVGPAVAQREQVERGRLASADDALGRQRRLGLGLVEHEGACAERVCGLQSGPPEGSVGGGRGGAGCPFHRGRSNGRESSRPGSGRVGHYRCGTAPGSHRTSLASAPCSRTLRAVPDGSQRARRSPAPARATCDRCRTPRQQGVRAVRVRQRKLHAGAMRGEHAPGDPAAARLHSPQHAGSPGASVRSNESTSGSARSTTSHGTGPHRCSPQAGATARSGSQT